MPADAVSAAPAIFDGPDFAWSLFQLIVQNVDSRHGARPGDLVAALAFLAGRIVQRALFRDAPESFRLDVSDNGAAFLRSDAMSQKLGALKPGTLASTLVEASMVSGARRFPEFAHAALDAQEAMQRRGGVNLRGVELSAAPRVLAAEIQGDVDGLVIDPSNRQALTRAAIHACGHAIGYHRARLCPAQAAELALSVALYAGWLDQRETVRQ
jgi:hypothetical protein